MTAIDPSSLRKALEDERADVTTAVSPLSEAARDAPTRAARRDAWELLGDLAGRAFGAPWEVAESAAFALLELARRADTVGDRVAVLTAMGRAFRNAWLVPYVHRRLADEEPNIVRAAVAAAGGLGFSGLEAPVAELFLTDATPPELRLTAIAALGRLGAESAAPKLVALVDDDAEVAAAALRALTEIRSPLGVDVALAELADAPPRPVLLAATRYLAVLGRREVEGVLRRLARDADDELRFTASWGMRALADEGRADATERILAALTEQDRAMRAVLARRLRTLPASEVMEHAELLLGDDPKGIVQVIGEIRKPEATHLLLRVAKDPAMPLVVRVQAAGGIEANEPWERDELLALVDTVKEIPVRVAAVQTYGAFAPLGEVLERLGELASDPSPALRGALLWALQLSASPAGIAAADRTRAEAHLRRALEDADPDVRRRAAYVAGNLDAAALVPELVGLARAEADRTDLRVAAFVGLAEVASPERFSDLVDLFQRENDPVALDAASRAIERTLLEAPSPERTVVRLRERLVKLLGAAEGSTRASAARVAGFTAGIEPALLVKLAVEDPVLGVREQALAALGRLGTAEAEATLTQALDDADPGLRERAAMALLRMDAVEAHLAVLEHIASESDRDAAARLASSLRAPRDDRRRFAESLRGTLRRLEPEDAAYEPLLHIEAGMLESASPEQAARSPDESIAELLPAWPSLCRSRPFEGLAKSARTAELLYASMKQGADADYSAPIVLWMKCLEGFAHTHLAPRLASLQHHPSALWELVDTLIGSSWPGYQRWLGTRWTDPILVGSLSADVPLRSVPNALREYQDRQMKRLDSPLSITEWARLLLLLGTEHTTGPRNVLRLSLKEPERAARLAHRLHTLAAVRNAVTHRASADSATLEAFRALYYGTFQDLVSAL